MAIPEVVHVPERQRFEVPFDDGPAVLDYVRTGAEVVFTHTGTPHARRGQGIAAQLVVAGLTWAAQEQLTVVPACWYVAQWLDQHPGEIDVDVRAV